jgi:hypothetical protein
MRILSQQCTRLLSTQMDSGPLTGTSWCVDGSYVGPAVTAWVLNLGGGSGRFGRTLEEILVPRCWVDDAHDGVLLSRLTRSLV